MSLPLEGMLVVDFSQFLAGPLAGLKLADFGARVIKIERPELGDLCRSVYLSETNVDGENTLFHAINRNKESYAANLKNPADMKKIRGLIARADVIIQNFRPGVVERLQLDYASVKKINPKIIYGSVSGYGNDGLWSSLPGQDLLAQALSGIMWLSGNQGSGPVPVGLALADSLAGNVLVQGILASLVKLGRTGLGSLVETSLLEVLIDFQFEVITTYLNDGGKLPTRSRANNAHAYLAAPYGVYETTDGHVALAMSSVNQIGELLGSEEIASFTDPGEWFSKRDEIKELLADHLKRSDTASILSVLQSEDIWAQEVMDWPKLFASDGFKVLGLIQQIELSSGRSIQTTRSPLCLNGSTLESPIGAPSIGEHTKLIDDEFGL